MLKGAPSQEPMLKMNLQLFAEGEPTPEPTPAPEPTPTPEPTPSPEPQPGTPEPEPTPQPQEGQKVKVKFNHEEKEIPIEEAVQLAQKGMNYEKAVERAKQEARDSWIAQQGYEWNGQPITNEAQYQQALAEQAEEQRRAQLQEQGIDPSIVDQYVSNNPVVKKAAELIQQQEQQQKQARDYGEFLDYFKSENGRDYNPSSDAIPNEVWAAVAQGKTLADAYARHDSRQLRAKLKAFEANKVNAASSPGSVTGNGTSTSELTVEMINNMSSQEQMRHWGEIKKVLKMK